MKLVPDTLIVLPNLKLFNLTGIRLKIEDWTNDSVNQDRYGNLVLAKVPNTLEALALSILNGDNNLGAYAIRDLVDEGGLEGGRDKLQGEMVKLCKEVVANVDVLPRSTLFKLRAVLNEMYKSKIGKFQP